MKSVILRMAFRNLKEHRRKSLTIGVIIASAAFLFILGSSLLETATVGMRKSYRDRFTGDLYITAPSSKQITAFGWGDQGSMNEPLPLLARHDDLKAFVAGLPGVEAVVSRSVAFVRVSKEDSDSKGATMLMGVDPEEYAKAFPEAFVVESGGTLGADGSGLLASSFLERGMGDASRVGERVLLSSLGMGASIREVRIEGTLPADGANPILDMVSYVNIDVLRGLLGQYDGASATDETLPAEAIDEAALFGGEAVAPAVTSGIDAESLVASLAGASETRLDPSAWQFVVVKVRAERDVPEVRTAIEEYVAREGIEASIHDWLEGAGMIASTVLSIKQLFYYICLVIAAVALLIIMNALIISVTERTGEIGTMRAIGATRSFVTRLIVTETVLLSAAAGAVGATAGSVALGVLAMTGIQAPNFFFRVIFGGEVLRPEIQAVSVAATIVAVLAIGAAASWYPTKIALRVSPATAMIRD